MTNPTSGAADLPEALRQKFEAWLPKSWSRDTVVDDDDGDTMYVDDWVQGAYVGYCAALTAQAISAEPAGAVSETVNFTDQSTVSPIEKARRYLTHVANKKPNNPYFFDDGYPRESIADDAAAALSVLEQLAASHGQAPAQTADFTTLGAAMRAIQQAIGLIGDPADERMRAVRRVLRGAVVVAEDSGDIPAQPAPPADSVLEDAARWQMVVLVGNEVMLHPEKRSYAAAVAAYMDAVHRGLDLTGAIDSARKQGGA